jgi:hypothetical protein
VQIAVVVGESTTGTWSIIYVKFDRGRVFDLPRDETVARGEVLEDPPIVTDEDLLVYATVPAAPTKAYSG